jgi:hypothetical protein
VERKIRKMKMKMCDFSLPEIPTGLARTEEANFIHRKEVVQMHYRNTASESEGRRQRGKRPPVKP